MKAMKKLGHMATLVGLGLVDLHTMQQKKSLV